MFSRIMVPVDLAHLPSLRKALQVAGDIAKHYGASVTFVGVTAATPGKLGHNPAEFGAKLDAFGAEQAKFHGIDADTRTVISHDPTTDVDDVLLAAVKDTGADLVIMASHLPGLAEHVFASHAGAVASR